MTDPVALRRQRLTGIALMCGAVATFSCLDATAKYLNFYMDTVQVVWARYVGAFVLALIFLNPIRKPGMMVTRRPVLQVFRSGLLLLSTVLNFVALRYLQMDEVLAFIFATPFLVAILSGPILGEWVGWRRWIAIGVGFIGVLVVARPGLGGLDPAAGYAVAGAICYAVYSIITRLLARTDSTETTLFYTNLVPALSMLPVVYFYWTPPASAFIIVLMVFIGASGGVGHYLLICGHRLAPASTLAPFIYTQLIWTMTAGYVVFGDVPSFWTIVGGCIVIGSGLYLLNRERQVGTAVTDGALPIDDEKKG